MAVSVCQQKLQAEMQIQIHLWVFPQSFEPCRCRSRAAKAFVIFKLLFWNGFCLHFARSFQHLQVLPRQHYGRVRAKFMDCKGLTFP